MDGGAPRGRGSIVLLPGLFQADPAQRRLEGARAVFARYPGLQVADICWTGWQEELGREIIAAKLAEGGKTIDGVWCNSGLQAVGSLRAYIAEGRSGAIPPHTGGDINLAYKLAIRHGVPQAAVDYPPAMGLRAVEAFARRVAGSPRPRRIDVPTEIVVTRGHATRSVRPDLWSDEHVRWDLPDDLILASGLGPSYDPRSFRVHYKGNRYNRSAADRAARSSSCRRIRPRASRRSRSFSRASPRRRAHGRGARSRTRAPALDSLFRRRDPSTLTGLLERDASGGLHPGPIAARLLLAPLRLRSDGGAGPETLLPVLRDDTDASVSLLVSDKERAFLGAPTGAPPGARGSDGGSRRIEAPVGRSPSGFAARLSLVLRPKASEAASPLRRSLHGPRRRGAGGDARRERTGVELRNQVPAVDDHDGAGHEARHGRTKEERAARDLAKALPIASSPCAPQSRCVCPRPPTLARSPRRRRCRMASSLRPSPVRR